MLSPKIYRDYKAHRPPLPDDLRCEISLLPDFAQAHGIPCLQIADFEADDVLCTLSEQLSSDFFVRIATRDKDLDQIVSSRIQTWDPFTTNSLRGPEQVWRDRGVGPDMVGDLLCLMGDSADNVPGVPGIDLKSAPNYCISMATWNRCWRRPKA